MSNIPTVEEELVFYKRAVSAWSRAVSIDCKPMRKSTPPHIGFLSDSDAAEAWNALNGLSEREEFFKAFRKARTIKVGIDDLFSTTDESEGDK